jgi:branched-chain amino acid transport system permease protein
MLPLARISHNALIVASLGLVMVLMEGARLASGTRELWLPPFLNQPLLLWPDRAFPVTLTLIQVLSIAVILAVIGAGSMVLSMTRWGRIWRAVSDDPLAAQLSGCNAGRAFVLAYGAAALYAALAGGLATSYYGTMDFGAGLLFGLKVVLIAAAGGQSHPLRSAGGAALFALGETLWSGYGPILWRDLVTVSLLALILVLSRKERAVP